MPTRPDPPPYRTNEYAPMVAITLGWVIALVVLLARHHEMTPRGQGWWLWVAVVGIAIGLWGIFLVALHHLAVRQRTERDGRNKRDADR